MQYQPQFADVLIGYYVLEEAREFDAPLEVAAYQRTVLVQPGRYPIKARLLLAGQQPHIETSSLVIHLPGKITHSAYPSLCGGIHYSGNTDTDLGQLSGTVLQPYAYDVARLVQNGQPLYQLTEHFVTGDGDILPKELPICAEALWIEAVKA